MGLFDNWSMENLVKNLNPADSTLGGLVKGDFGKVAGDVGGALNQAVDFNKALLGGMASPVGAWNKYVQPHTVGDRFSADMDAFVKGEQERVAREQQAALDAQAKAKADKEALYQGAGFMDALQSDMPQMFRKREKPGSAAFGAPLGGGF